MTLSEEWPAVGCVGLRLSAGTDENSGVSSPEDFKELTRRYNSDSLVDSEVGKVRVATDDEVSLCFEGGSQELVIASVMSQ